MLTDSATNSKNDFDEAMAEKDKLIVIDFFATWCGPCKVIAPQVVKFSDKYPTAKFFKLDVDDVADVAHEVGVRAMPTFILFRNGEKLTDVVGANPKALEAAIVEHLKPEKDNGASPADKVKESEEKKE